jgi:hypothetical protein
MQRSIEERHAPKRRTGPRRHPRAQVFGFTPRQWPFIFVLIGKRRPSRSGNIRLAMALQC